jgi:hypothetical protein
VVIGLRHPLVLADYGRWALDERRREPGSELPPARLEPLAVAEALARTGLEGGALDPGPAMAAARQRLERLPALGSAGTDGVAARLAGAVALGELVYALVRAVRPSRVVETGVATGVTSAHVLAGLEDGEAGTLDSIDLPPLALVQEGLIGAAVPPDLHGRWRYRWGSARRLLVPILRAAPPAAVFVHDSDHSYANMRWELKQAADALPPGSWLVADDASSHAAAEHVADAVAGRLAYVSQPGKPTAAAVIRLPG